MQVSTKRLLHHLATDRAIALEEQPSRYWGLALIALCAASWATILGAAKLLLAVI